MRIRIVLALASALVVASLAPAYAQERQAARGTPKTDSVIASSLMQSPAPPPQGRDAGRPSNGPVSAPELDVNSAGTALTLLITALLLVRGRRDAMD